MAAHPGNGCAAFSQLVISDLQLVIEPSPGVAGRSVPRPNAVVSVLVP